jgi:hemerythrin
MISWKEEYNLDIKLIDIQHQAFVFILNKLLDSLNEIDKMKVGLKEVFDGIEDYATNHFATEEKYFCDFHYAEKDQHILLHKNFIKKMEEFRLLYEEDKISTAFNLADFLEDWLFNHIQNVDRRYVVCFHEHGLH